MRLTWQRRCRIYGEWLPVSDEILRLSITRSAVVWAAARAVADAASSVGLGSAQHIELEALLSEALVAIVDDSFEGADEIDIVIVASHEPGQIDIVVHQYGAPSSYVTGGLPPRLQALLTMGYADSVMFVSDGVHGSELRISRSLSRGGLVADAGFVNETEAAEEQLVDPDALVLRQITSDDVVEVARLYFRTYGYTKIGSPWIYEPDVFRHKLEESLHEAVVAVTPSGRVVGHGGLLRSSASSLSGWGGPLAVEPAYRQYGLSNKLVAAFVPVMVALGLRGLFSEAVTAHPASQKAISKIGATEVGLVLGRQPAAVEFLGFDGPSGFRRAVMVMYVPFGESVSATVHAPPRYQEFIERIYEKSGITREVKSDLGRIPDDLPAESRFTTELTAETKFAQIHVDSYGTDFLAALQGLIRQLEHSRFEVITVRLPLSDPLTTYFGAGLGELGLSFNGVFPEQDNGDELVLGICFELQDPETIATASEWGDVVKSYVLNDREQIQGTMQTRARSRASVARILDAL